MALWAIRWDNAFDPDLAGCSLIALYRTSRFTQALIDCDDTSAARLRNHRGVTSFARARDGETYSDGARSGMHVIVEGGGTSWRKL